MGTGGRSHVSRHPLQPPMLEILQHSALKQYHNDLYERIAAAQPKSGSERHSPIHSMLEVVSAD